MASTLVVDRARTERWSSLARHVDPGIPSNWLAIGGALTAALVVAFAGFFGVATGLDAFSAAIGVFLSWAMARELDPDHPAAAAIAMPVSLLLLMLLGPSSLLVSTGVLLGLRMTAGTVGTPLRSLDIGGIVVLSTLLGTNPLGTIGVAVLVAGVLADEPHVKRSIAIIAASTTGFVAAALISGVAWTWTAPSTVGWAALAVGTAAAISVIPAATPASPTDRQTGLVRRERVTAARVAAGVAILAGFVLTGEAGIVALAGTTIAALTGTAIRRIDAYRRHVPSV